MLGALLGLGVGKKVKKAMEDGAQVIDVRTTGEYASGHKEGSINIPLDQIPARLSEIQKIEGPIVVCCASGMRSAQAEGFLKQQGLTEVYNGGPWTAIADL